MEKDDLEHVYGIHAVIEMLESGKDVETVFIKQNTKGPRLTELRKLIKQKGVSSKDLPQQAFNKYGNKNHQGVVALISPIQYVNLEMLIPKLFEEGKLPVILILDQVTDVRNFGAICRSASCFGVDAVVVPAKGSAFINDFAIKSSAGAIFHLNICRVKSLTHTLDFLKESGMRIMAISEKGEKNYYDNSYSDPVVIMMGSEDKGISKAHLTQSDEVLKIPMQGPIESLNVSVACGILLSEVHKQRLDA